MLSHRAFCGERTMKCSGIKRQVLTSFMVVMLLFIDFISHGIAQENTGTVTGRVIDLDGNPVAELPIFIAPLDLNEGWNMWAVILPYDYAQLHRTRTDLEVGLKPGAHIKDVEVTVQPRMRVRGRILFKDGTPLANTRIDLRARSRNVDGTGSSGNGGDLWLDPEGYFVFYIDEKNDSAFYTFSVEYHGLAMEAEPIRLDPGYRFDGLTLTLTANRFPPNDSLKKRKQTNLNRLRPHQNHR